MNRRRAVAEVARAYEAGDPACGK